MTRAKRRKRKKKSLFSFGKTKRNRKENNISNTRKKNSSNRRKKRLNSNKFIQFINGKHRNKVFIGIFVLGFIIMMYPLVSQMHYRIESNYEVQEFDEAKGKFPAADVKKKIQLAKDYNTTLDPSKIIDAFSKKQKAGLAEYARMLELKEKIGYVEIPQIDQKVPIYAGTSEDILQKGAGHLEGTSLPVGGKSTHAVITAHRGLPTAKLFTNLDKMKKGDIFYIHNIEKTLAYKVDRILTVEPSNFKPVMVTNGDDYCTLLTCTPYMINSHRLLVRGHRIPYELKVHKKAEEETVFKRYMKIIIISVLLLLALIVYLIWKKYRKGKNKKLSKLNNREDKNTE